MSFLKKPFSLFVIVVFCEISLFFLISKFISQWNIAGMNHRILPIFLVMIASAVLSAVFVRDSFVIKRSMDSLQGASLLSKRLRWLSILFSFASAILLLGLQCVSLVINFFWGIYVQLAVFFFIMARKHDMSAENISSFLKDGDKLRMFNPFQIIASFYKIKFYGMTVCFVIGAAFVDCIILYGERLDVQWRWYDLPGLYLFFVFLGVILWGILASLGYVCLRKA